MKLGQAIHHKNWQVAASVLQRLQKQSMEMGDDISLPSGSVCCIKTR